MDTDRLILVSMKILAELSGMAWLVLVAKFFKWDLSRLTRLSWRIIGVAYLVATVGYFAVRNYILYG